MRCLCRMRSASSSVVPTGTVTRFSLVITSLTGMSKRVFKAQVAVGENAHQPAVRASPARPEMRYLRHDFQRFAQCDVRRNRHRIHDHAAFRALHAVHFFGLAVDGHVAVHDANAALLRDGDGQRIR